MVRRRSLRAALTGAVAALLVAGPLVAPATAYDPELDRPRAHSDATTRADVTSRAARRATGRAPRAEATPLTVTIETLSPSAIPAQGRVRVAGTVTNADTLPWLAINVYSFISPEPMTTRAQVAAAATVDEAQAVGERITDFGNFDTIDSLAPGESGRFSFTVDVDLLQADTPGVYWFGVHALGQRSDEGRDELAVADGRARTFLPLVPPQREGRQAVSIVVPLRAAIAFDDDGSVDDLVRWTTTLSNGGRLRALVEMAATSGDRTVSWLVDPAVVAAVRQLAAGNPPRSLESNLEEGEDDGEPGPSDGPSEGGASPSLENLPTETPSPSPPDEPVDPEDDPTVAELPEDLDATTLAAAEAARGFLERLRAAMGTDDEVLLLPYGDVDVSAAMTHDRRPVYARAVARSGTGLEGLEVTGTPAVAPPSGFLGPDAIAELDEDAVVLVGDKMFGRAPAVASVDGRRLAVTSVGTAQGGPLPGDPVSPVALRQRILADAAVRFLKPSRAPLVMVLGGEALAPVSSTFFPGLDLDWMDLTSVQDATADVAAENTELDELRYPQRQSAYELDAANFVAAEALRQAGEALQSLLTLNNLVGSAVSDQALVATGYAARARPDTSRVAADRSREWIEDRMGEVTVSAPNGGVTLSSINGSFPATITNELDHPVTVTLLARADDQDDALRISQPGEIDLQAGGRANVLLDARTDTPGVHEVTIMVADKTGRPLGGSDELTIRSARVSNVIWLFLAIGIGLLFGTIAFRLVRRVRAARA